MSPIKYLTTLGLACLLVYAGFRRFLLLDGSFANQDLGILLVYVDQLAQGRLAFVDFQSVYSSGLSLLLLPITVLARDDVLAIRLLFEMLHMILCFLIVWRSKPRWGEGVLLALPVAVLWPAPALTFYFHFALLILAIGLLLGSGKHRFSIFGGFFLVGLSVTVRYDFALPVAGLLLLIVLSTVVSRGRLPDDHNYGLRLTALLLGILPGAVNLLLVFVQGELGSWLSHQSAVREGRFLVVDFVSPPWALLALFGALGLITVGLIVWPDRRNVPLLVTVSVIPGAYLLAIIQAVQRADGAHYFYAVWLIWLSTTCVVVTRCPGRTKPAVGTFLALFALALLGLCAAGPIPIGWRAVAMQFTPFAAPLSNPLTGGIEVQTQQLCGLRRCIPVGPAEASDYSPIVRRLDQDAEASVFVGPSDLRSAFSSDNWLYSVVRNPSCSRFLEMNPGSSNGPDADLRGDLRDCDYLVLTDRFNEIIENSWSQAIQAESPNAEILNDFHLVERQGLVSLWQRNDLAGNANQ